MLVVHPASTCDVCLEGYTGRSESQPHSIACGHVFCLSCLQSLRQHICPLCRSPFEESDVRRIHVDRIEQNSGSIGIQRMPSPPILAQQPELRSDNALGLFSENPHASEHATELHEKITDLVLRSSSASVRGVRELIHEIQDFFSAEAPDNHRNLRAAFLLLYRLTELQGRFRHTENQNMELHAENARDRQALREWERKYQDSQRSRARDQESARNVEASLRERLRLEELEWQRKYDFIAEEFANLRRELEESTFLPGRHHMPEPPQSAESTKMYFFDAEEPTSRSADNRSVGKKPSSLFSKEDEEDMYTNFNPCLFHLSPLPPKITLNESRDELSLVPDYEDEAAKEMIRQKQRSQIGISRASDSPAAMRLSPALKPIRMPSGGRSRSDSAPYRLTARDIPSTKFALAKEQQPEASSSAPSSYVNLQSHHDEMPTMTPEVRRLYSLLDKPTPAVPTRGTEQEVSPTRPALSRSTSFHQSRPQPREVTQPRLNIQPSGLSAQVQAQAAALSPIQKTPPRPVLPHMHSFAAYSTPPRAAPVSTPVSPKETRINVSARVTDPGMTPRRPSVSGPAGNTRPTGGSPPAVFVSPSTLSFTKPHPVGRL